MATHTTATQSAIELAKQSVIAYNEKNWEAAKEALAADAVYDEVATARRLSGQATILPAWKDWAVAFPDSRATFENAISSENIVTLELRWRGTHKGPLNLPSGKAEPTGKSIDIRACQIVEVVDGKTRSIRHYFDMATMLRQLGIS
ncbi:MAG TPA: ester cyclase [Vicinamibacterales bacterium]|nr:ester cyclase [Vicinamibacterales bacterium]